MDMKRIPRQMACLVGAAIVATMIGCGSTARQESTGEYVDDTVITTRVKTAILREPALKVLQINVETYKGVVQLSGFVDNQAMASKAADIARATPGVTSVRNDIRLR